ncbi:TPA: hypothetical protein ACXEMK_003854 [Enterobacter roggenkampii]
MNVINKVWHFVRPYIFKYYVAFFCGGMFWMFLDVYVTKGIDASFVSAVMDTVMATAATIALIKAKKIWDDKGIDHGHKFAMQLLTDVVPKMVPTDKLTDTIRRLEHGIRILNNETLVLKSINTEQRHKIKIRELNFILNKLRELSDSLLNDVEKINETRQVLFSQINICGVGWNRSHAATALELHFSRYMRLQQVLLEITFSGFDAFFILMNSKGVIDENIMDLETELFNLLNEESLKTCLQNIGEYYVIDEDLHKSLGGICDRKYKVSEYFLF